MNTIIKAAIFAISFTIFSGCINKEISSELQAQDATNNALKNYCQKASSEDCLGLNFLKVEKFNDKWLVQYQSKHYQYAVIVGKNASAEITREPM